MRVVAASVDPIDNVRSLKESLRVGFPMYAEVDAAAVSAATGAHMQTGDKTFLHATAFLVNPEGTVINAVYSTGPIGRFTGIGDPPQGSLRDGQGELEQHWADASQYRRLVPACKQTDIISRVLSSDSGGGGGLIWVPNYDGTVSVIDPSPD